MGKAILNFQITWTVLIFLTYIFLMGGILLSWEVSYSLTINPFLWIGIMVFPYVYNFVLIIVNTLKIYNGKEIKYFPSIRFLR